MQGQHAGAQHNKRKHTRHEALQKLHMHKSYNKDHILHTKIGHVELVGGRLGATPHPAKPNKVDACKHSKQEPCHSQSNNETILLR